MLVDILYRSFVFGVVILYFGLPIFAESSPAAITVLGDGVVLPVDSGKATVPYDVSTVLFEMRPSSIRCRYMLKGLDEDWVAQADDMNFGIRFLDANGDQILQTWFPVTGQSAGWQGEWRKSPFISRREQVAIPKNAAFFAVAISSSGPPVSTGIFVLRDIGVSSNGAVKEYLKNSLKPGLEPSRWIKSGTHPSMASVLGENTKSPVFVIRDDDLTAHADLETELFPLAPEGAGDALTLSWQEAYNVGRGGPYGENYVRLPAGRYRFVMENLSLNGMPTGEVASVEVVVKRPYWGTIWFWALIASAVLVLAFNWGRHLIRKKINRDLRHARLIADERLRIARDLHDGLGTRLSHIYLLCSHSENISDDTETRYSFKQISEMSRELISALSETVWMLNSNNDDLESLVDFLCRLVSELCRLADIRCRIDAMSVNESMGICQEFRHNFSLAVKETINNALRHSGATEIGMKISMDGRILTILITDNGIGLGSLPKKSGNGLESVAQRMELLRGKYTLTERKIGGLEVELSAPIR